MTRVLWHISKIVVLLFIGYLMFIVLHTGVQRCHVATLGPGEIGQCKENLEGEGG